MYAQFVDLKWRSVTSQMCHYLQMGNSPTVKVLMKDEKLVIIEHSQLRDVVYYSQCRE